MEVRVKNIYVLLILLLIIVTACTTGNSSGDSNKQCNDGICVTYSIEEPISSLVPTKFNISVTADHDSQKMYLSLFPEDSAIVIDMDKTPNNTMSIETTDSRYRNYEFDIKAGDIRFFEGTVTYPKTSDDLKKIQYNIHIMVGTFSSGPLVSLLSSVYLSGDGLQINQGDINGTVIIVPGTAHPVVSDTPIMDVTIVPNTWQETQQRLLLITPTSTVTATPTAPGYPAP
jgi:hypothetical protein